MPSRRALPPSPLSSLITEPSQFVKESALAGFALPVLDPFVLPATIEPSYFEKANPLWDVAGVVLLAEVLVVVVVDLGRPPPRSPSFSVGHLQASFLALMSFSSISPFFGTKYW